MLVRFLTRAPEPKTPSDKALLAPAIRETLRQKLVTLDQVEFSVDERRREQQ